MSSIYKTIYSLVKFFPEKKKYFPVQIFMLILSNIIMLIIPILVMKVIDYLKGNQSININHIIYIMAGWFSAIIIVVLLELSLQNSFKLYSNKTLSIIYKRIIESEFHKPFSFWINQNSKVKSAEIMNDLQALIPIIGGGFLTIIRHIFILLLTVILLITINWKLTLGISVLIPFFIISLFLWKTKLRQYYNIYRTENENFSAVMVEFLQTIPQMRFFNIFPSEMSSLNRKYETYLNKQYDYYILSNTRNAYSKAVSSIAPIYLSFICFIYLFYNLATIGQFFAFWGIFTMLISAVKGSSSLYNNFLEASVVYDKLKDSLEIFKNYDRDKISISIINCIMCDNVVYSFNGCRDKSIQIPNFVIHRGDWIEIRGESGIGKTTLLKLLLGILTPLQGQISINGISIDKINKPKFWQKIGYVEQNGYIYSRSLKDNIVLGRDFSKEKWNKAVNTARLKNLVNSNSKIDDLLLGENGIKLSGGERQKILIARALYQNPEWLLLDEPFTGIDFGNQIEIKNVLESIRRKVTLLIITHNHIPFLNFDKTIIIDK